MRKLGCVGGTGIRWTAITMQTMHPLGHHYPPLTTWSILYGINLLVLLYLCLAGWALCRRALSSECDVMNSSVGVWTFRKKTFRLGLNPAWHYLLSKADCFATHKQNLESNNKSNKHKNVKNVAKGRRKPHTHGKTASSVQSFRAEPSSHPPSRSVPGHFTSVPHIQAQEKPSPSHSNLF